MSEPKRMRDDVSASAEARRLLRPALSTRPLPKSVRERSAARLDRVLIMPAAASLMLWLKGIALATGAVLLFVAAPVLLRRGSSTPAPVAAGPIAARPASRPSPLAPTTSHSAEPLAAPTASDPRPLRGPWPPPPLAPPRVDGDSLAREAAMLEHARAVLDQSPAVTLERLEAHRTEFPSGELAMERELLAIDALSRLGRSAEARARGEAMLQAAPGSIYDARVRAILDRLPKP